jgi:F-box/WD-40 domain protein 5
MSDASMETEECASESDDLSEHVEKYLIFTTGSKTYTPHQIGFKRIKSVSFPRKLNPGPSLRERLAEREREKQNAALPRPEPNWSVYEEVADKFDKVDHLIDLHGHIIGMGLSPDHRYCTRLCPAVHSHLMLLFSLISPKKANMNLCCMHARTQTHTRKSSVLVL